MDFKPYIKELRPHLSEKSLNAYNSTLKNIYKKIYCDTTNDIDENMTNIINKLNNDKLILKTYKDLECKKRAGKLAALVVLNPDNINYYDAMIQDINNINEIKNEKTDNEIKNELSINELNEIYNQQEIYVNELFNKEELTMKDIQDIQNYIILSLYILIKPRRALDYTEMKIRNINKDDLNYNYIDKNNFIFNIYKTSKKKGTQIIKIPSNLRKILNKWLIINTNDYLLIDNKNKKLTPVTLNQRLNKIFKKNYSINGLRHTYLSSTYKDIIDKVKTLKNDMVLMGSSINQTEYYIKK